MSRMAGRDHGSTPRHVKLTHDEYVHFPDDGMRHELIDGEHFVTPSPNTRHQRISQRLSPAIGTWLADHPSGELFCAPLDVVFTRFDVVEPDLIYVSHEHKAKWLTAQHAVGADLVIEIGSPSTRTRDETIKLDALFELAAARIEELTTSLLPGFHLPLATLFRE